MGAWIGPYNPTFETVSALRRRLTWAGDRVASVQAQVGYVGKAMGLTAPSSVPGWNSAVVKVYNQLDAYQTLRKRLEWM